MIDKDWNGPLNDQIIQSLSVLKENIDIRECVVKKIRNLKYG